MCEKLPDLSYPASYRTWLLLLFLLSLHSLSLNILKVRVIIKKVIVNKMAIPEKVPHPCHNRYSSPIRCCMALTLLPIVQPCKNLVPLECHTQLLLHVHFFLLLVQRNLHFYDPSTVAINETFLFHSPNHLMHLVPLVFHTCYQLWK